MLDLIFSTWNFLFVIGLSRTKTLMEVKVEWIFLINVLRCVIWMHSLFLDFSNGKSGLFICLCLFQTCIGLVFWRILEFIRH